MPDMICVPATTPWPKAMISCAFEMFAQLAIEVCGTNSVPIANGTYQYKSGVIPHKTFWFWNKLIHLDSLLSALHFNSVLHLLSIVNFYCAKRLGMGVLFTTAVRHGLKLLWFSSHYPSFAQSSPLVTNNRALGSCQSLDTVTSSAITQLFIISCLRWWCSRLVHNSAVYHLLIRQHLYLWRILYALLPVTKLFRTKDSTYLCANLYWNFLFTADLYSIIPLGAFVNVNTCCKTLNNAMFTSSVEAFWCS